MIDTGALAKNCKRMFVAPEGFTFVARDFSGIEAVLVGALAGSARFTRLAKLGVHDYFMAHGILKPRGLISSADLPDLSWSDDDLKACFKVNKERFKGDDGPLSPRQVAKRTIYLSSYLGTPGKMNEEFPESFPTKKDAAITQGTFFELFPEITRWHMTTCRAVDGDREAQAAVLKMSYGAVHAHPGYIRAPSGFIHRFYRVFDWKKVAGKWEPSYGDDAKRLIAFLPQHTAAFIGKEAGKRLYHDHTELALRVQAVRHARGLVGTSKWKPQRYDSFDYTYPIDHPWMRLFIHDEWLGETPQQYAEEVDQRLLSEMAKPIPQLPLDPAWGMGSHLTIGTEGKQGTSWGDMR